jgi:hypothetical protein
MTSTLYIQVIMLLWDPVQRTSNKVRIFVIQSNFQIIISEYILIGRSWEQLALSIFSL